jgi:hypothetical protein
MHFWKSILPDSLQRPDEDIWCTWAKKWAHVAICELPCCRIMVPYTDRRRKLLGVQKSSSTFLGPRKYALEIFDIIKWWMGPWSTTYQQTIYTSSGLLGRCSGCAHIFAQYKRRPWHYFVSMTKDGTTSWLNGLHSSFSTVYISPRGFVRSKIWLSIGYI